ncbi:MAG TPA: DinB family protein [Myxococcaceae bacterium]|nr:DinB family protein [Myxococcaceae bacterium]
MRIAPAVLEELKAFPGKVAALAKTVAPTWHRTRLRGEGFALVEHAWHLADLEREGFGARITRLATEDRPSLPDFDGERAARERRYLDAELELGLKLFAHARAFNLRALEALSDAEASRVGVQEGVGTVTAADLPAKMLAHDRGHAAELAELLDALR